MESNIEKITFDDRPAVKRTFQFRGLKIYTIDFLIGNIAHNLQYSAPASEYNKYLPIIIMSMESYEPILHDTSDSDVIKHFVAKRLRLAKLMIANRNFELALQFVEEGLEVSPTHPDLLELKKQIEDK